ncbi:SusC/RagA family TonB-linked outer membrane protein [Dyadobacter sp. 3J3]|uniref:SusC/RagA family TonB-linked outer membrane protein n=1 Tax=Dyadobacter sp. 3J3 TaxID=2606600 RepID=UPI00135A8943|nr:SusC/RagA family TonB-linked outer membrane protein [Dyadobacter sp. 3J3]
MKLLYCSPGKLLPFLLYLLLIVLASSRQNPLYAQSVWVKGKIIEAKNGQPLTGATIQIRGGLAGTTSDASGLFSLAVPADNAHLVVSFIGYRSIDTLVQVPLQKPLVFSMQQDAAVINEIAVTGYQSIPKERATGSFVQIDNELVNRRVSTNILDRLDGISSGLQFNSSVSTAKSANPLGRNLGIRIRGESTLADGTQVSRDPLIVLDNFPFEGNLDNINPNDVESITILKDAAAASIWGARAGNGVIVIVTKKGKANQPVKFEFNTNLTVSNKPNIHYDQSFLKSAGYLDAEQYLFSKGYFDADLVNTSNRPPISPAVQTMSLAKAGTISQQQLNSQLDDLRGTDVRDDFEKYVYQKSVKQQYSLGLRGGTANATYHLSAGYDKNIASAVGNSYHRFTVNSLSTYSPLKGLKITAGLNYSTNKTTENNYQNQYGSMSVGGRYTDLFPYARLADANGNALAVTKNYSDAYTTSAASRGFLDWKYRPLDEIALADNSTSASDLILKTAVSYAFSKFLNAEIQYQNERQLIAVNNYHSPDTYYARDLVNRFSVAGSAGDFTYPVPKGGVLEFNQAEYNANNLRTQLNFDQTFGKKHVVRAIAGAEIRQLKTSGFNRLSYGYQNETGIAVNNLDYSQYLPTNPAGSSMIPYPDGNVSGFTNRFISYYANGSYTFDKKYTLTLSGRRDGANIFGAKTNDRITPLWSAGAGWDISSERFYHASWLPYLKLRVSYGTSGNVYQGSVYVKGNYLPSDLTGALYINNITAPNAELKWETIKTLNLGVDFALIKDRISGTAEYYIKRGTDLIQNQPLAPSAGFGSFYGNSAGTKTQGIDLTLHSNNLTGRFKWSTTALISHLADKITKFDAKMNAVSMQGTSSSRVGVVGKPIYGLYSYKWAGLDPLSGDPQGYLNGEVSKNYAGIINNFTADSLVYHGSAVPTWFGSIRNDFSFRRWSLSLNLVYKLGYVMRRPGTSINYTEILSGFAHQDFENRWQNPGDALKTQVPSMVYPSNAQRNTFYRYSQALIEKADHLRLQDIRLSYALAGKAKKTLRFDNAQLYLYASNLGILWRANKPGLDPDYVDATQRHLLPNPASVSLGLRAEF